MGTLDNQLRMRQLGGICGFPGNRMYNLYWSHTVNGLTRLYIASVCVCGVYVCSCVWLCTACDPGFNGLCIHGKCSLDKRLFIRGKLNQEPWWLQDYTPSSRRAKPSFCEVRDKINLCNHTLRLQILLSIWYCDSSFLFLLSFFFSSPPPPPPPLLSLLPLLLLLHSCRVTSGDGWFDGDGRRLFNSTLTPPLLLPWRKEIRYVRMSSFDHGNISSLATPLITRVLITSSSFPVSGLSFPLSAYWPFTPRTHPPLSKINVFH